MISQELQPIAERERSREVKETKESEQNPEAQAAAALERAEVIVKEVKTNKKQMQNILLHMGQVQAAITALRSQLAITDNVDARSVAQDAEAIERLKQKISEHKEELLAMQGDLYNAILLELAETNPNMPLEEREVAARLRVQQMIALLEKEE